MSNHHPHTPAKAPLQTQLQPFPFYPLVLALYPALALLSSNLGQAQPGAALRPLIFSLLGSALLYGALRLIFRRWDRAAALTAAVQVLFFGYGYFYLALEGGALGRHRYLAPLWLALGGVSLWLLLRRRSVAALVTTGLNAVSVILVALPLLQVGVYQVRQAQPAAETGALSASTLPDVYYIVLDGYGRADAIEAAYGFDNAAFTQALQDLGFVLPECAQSNYMWTALSLSSTLNMDYQDVLYPAGMEHPDNVDWAVYHGLIQHSAVRANLEALGYQTVAFETSFAFTEMADADWYIAISDNPLSQQAVAGVTPTAFETLFLRTTALRVLLETRAAWLPAAALSANEGHYQRVSFTLEQLPGAAELPGPKFVFLHLPAPHSPFVFKPDGSYSDVGEEATGYPDTVAYLNNRMIPILQSILEHSATPPIIVLQGDHGWDQPHRLQILNALYLPGENVPQISPTLTPVNTFRVIFNTYFGGSYPLLPDVSYNSPEGRKLDFSVAPFACP